MSRSAIEALVPHAGPMCLLEDIVAWDETQIDCRCVSHRRPDHPLRHDGRLGPMMLIEYAAQAVALHGGLLAREHGLHDGVNVRGRLVALRDIVFDDELVDAAAAPVLAIHAHRTLGGPSGSIYGFDIRCEGRLLVAGRLTVKTIDSIAD